MAVERKSSAQLSPAALAKGNFSVSFSSVFWEARLREQRDSCAVELSSSVYSQPNMDFPCSAVNCKLRIDDWITVRFQ